MLFNKRLRDSVKEDFFMGGGGKVSNFSERDKRDLPIFFTDEGSRRGLSKILLM